MARQQRFILLPLLGTILLGLLISVYMGLWKRKRSAKSKPSASSTTTMKHSVETSPAEALKYWTPDRMREAKAVNMPQVDNLERRKEGSPHTSGPNQA